MFSLAAVPCARLVEVTTSSFTRCRFAAELPFRQARAMSSWRRKRPSMAADGCRSVPYSAWGRSRCTASMVQARQLDETGEIIISGHAQTDDVSVTSELAVWSAGGEVEGTASLQGPWESAARERGFRLVPVPASSPPSQPGPLSDPHLIPPPAPAFPLTSQPTLEAPAGETPDGLLQHPPNTICAAICEVATSPRRTEIRCGLARYRPSQAPTGDSVPRGLLCLVADVVCTASPRPLPHTPPS